MVDAVFAFSGIAPAIVGRRIQPPLDTPTQFDIFLLDFVAEGHGALDALADLFGMRVVKKPFKDSQGFVVRERDD